MRKGMLSDEYIIGTNPAFFAADEKTHQRTLETAPRGGRRPYRGRRPQIPFYTLYDAARYVDRANPYETAHEMVVNYTATVTLPAAPSAAPSTTPSTAPSTAPPAAPPAAPSVAPSAAPSAPPRAYGKSLAAQFDFNFPDLKEMAIDQETKAFLILSRLDPYRVLNAGMTRHKTMYMPKNSFAEIEQRALDMTKRNKAAYERVVQAVARLVLEETEFDEDEADERSAKSGKTGMQSSPNEAEFTYSQRPMYAQTYVGLVPIPQPPWNN